MGVHSVFVVFCSADFSLSSEHWFNDVVLQGTVSINKSNLLVIDTVLIAMNSESSHKFYPGTYS